MAPGASIGTLVIDLASTSGGATFDAGSTFEFELAAPGTSDLLSFTGYTAGDVLFNDNVVNFLDDGGLAPRDLHAFPV